MFTAMFEARFPRAPTSEGIIAITGDIWKRRGWHVFERDGFRKPNRFAYTPDGYSLQIVTAYPAGYPPTITGVSPCYPGELMRDDLEVPVILPAQ